MRKIESTVGIESDGDKANCAWMDESEKNSPTDKINKTFLHIHAKKRVPGLRTIS